MENSELTSLDPDSYELIYVCHICNMISTKPICDSDHNTDISIADFEHFIKPTILRNNNKIVNKGGSAPKPNICAVIPRFVKTEQPIYYLCPTCGHFSSDMECKKKHVMKTLADVCNMCGSLFESIEKMAQHRARCNVPVDKYFTNNSSFANIISSYRTTDQMMYVVQPVALYLPENIASKVQKSCVGTGQHKVVAASVDTKSSKKEKVKSLSEDDFAFEQDILEWDESMDLAVLNMDDPYSAKLENYEILNEGATHSKQVMMESTKFDKIYNHHSEHKMIENRKRLCCVTCGVEFLDLETLVVHYLSHGNSTFICQFCLRRYSSPHWFKFHMKTHLHELPIICHMCDDSFLSTKIHQEHMETVHHLSVPNIAQNFVDNQKNVSCLECGRRFRSEKQLNSHRKMHEMVKGSTVQLKNEITAINQPVIQNSTNKRSMTSVMSTDTNAPQPFKRRSIHIFECNICSATIHSIEEIRQHIMSHDPDRPKKCESCDERFSTTAQMQQHECLKHGSELNTCTDCSKVFSHAAGLTCHLKTHHQLDTISCDMCQLKFKMLSTYLIHRSRNH